jgi:hypothetical protein
MPASPQPVRTLARRRGALIGVGLALVALGALAFLFVSARMNETREVIAVVDDLERGSLISADDVAVASAVTDPRLAPVPADRIEDVIGLRASTDLVAGTLLTDASLAAEVIPGDGQSVVGVALMPAQMPGEPLLAGDTILIVDTPAAGEAPSSETPTAIEATVLRTHHERRRSRWWSMLWSREAMLWIWPPGWRPGGSVSCSSPGSADRWP